MKESGLIPVYVWRATEGAIRQRCFCLALLAAVALAATCSPPAAAENGVSDNTIVFGQSAAFDGPVASLGIGFRDGLLAAFAEANREGGVNGRRLQLVSYDDGYEPEISIANTHRLIEEDGVFALIGEVGTPTSRSAQPIAQKSLVPFVGAFTGASFLRNPELPNVVNIRASYDQEAEALVDYLTTDLGLKRIAVLYQDDTFGRAGLDGVTAALERRDVGLVADGTYMRNTTAVKRALLTIRKADPQAVIIVGAYKPAAAFIRTADTVGMEAVFAALSFVGSNALAAELGSVDDIVLVSQVVPMFDNEQLPLVSKFLSALREGVPGAAPSFVALEGYLAGRLVVEALNRLGTDPTRQAFLDLFQSTATFDIDGLRLTYGPKDNQGSDQVYLTAIGRNGDFTEVDRKGQK
ncbi:MAG: ABC transporter substrate-binding protein [Hyphomicrobiales bacterium]|nr:ABC transporter substrate-binding protein [Hyphomicrobiales bacterium]MCP5001409.1 ABC transporter substrate-binding protein [Hyphomicrobiales bacterium]